MGQSPLRQVLDAGRLMSMFNTVSEEGDASVRRVPFFTRCDAPQIVWLSAVFIMGGASRSTEVVQHLLRMLAIGYIAWSLCQNARARSVFPRTPARLLTALFVIMVLQLVPLPPVIWEHLPGRALFCEAGGPECTTAIWRPFSIAPTATLNALLAMSIPLATCLCCQLVLPRNATRLVLVVAILALGSAALSIAQLLANDDLWVLRVTSPGAATGVFANRNHQALLLAMLIPILTFCETALIARGYATALVRPVAGVLRLALFPLILVTGSRAGLGLLIIASIGSAAIHHDRAGVRATIGWSRLWSPAGQIGTAIALTLAIAAIASPAAISRLSNESVSADLRWSLVPTLTLIAGRYFPVGAGFGTFPVAFQIDEPVFALDPTWLNHAHNEPFELLIEGGLPLALVLLALIMWLGKASIHAWHKRDLRCGEDVLLARLGTLLVALIFVASLSDYPARTPLVQSLLIIACWLLGRKPVAHSETEPIGPAGCQRGPVPSGKGSIVRTAKRPPL